MKRQTQHNFASVYSAKTSHICDYILVPLPSLLVPAYFHSESFDKLLLLRRLSVVDSDGLSDVESWRNTGSGLCLIFLFCENAGLLPTAVPRFRFFKGELARSHIRHLLLRFTFISCR